MKCTKCSIEQEEFEFWKNESRCKTCMKNKYKKWALENKEKRLAINKAWIRDHPEAKARRNAKRRLQMHGKKWRNRKIFT